MTQDVRIGVPRVDFVLGPDVEVDCGTFTCESNAVRVLAPREEIAVSLAAQGYHGEVVELLGRHDDRVGLRVNWASPQYPWNRYAWRQERGMPVSPELQDAFLKLRRILVRFRAEGFDEIARHEDLIENSAVAGSGLARSLLQFCIESRLIRKARPWYVLERQAMNQLGIHWQDIRERRMSPTIVQFLRNFLQSHS